MRLSPFILATAVAFAGAPPAAAQGRSLDLAAPPSPVEAPYGIGRPSAGQALSAGVLGSRFVTDSAPAPTASLPPGVRADGKPTTVCPMPVEPAQGDSAPMPTASGGSTALRERMPLAPAGCVDSLGSSR
jgi:hypothetical protein